MSVESGSQVGPYRVEGRSESGWFMASEVGLNRQVSVLVAELPEDETASSAIRARARSYSGLDDARLLPVYGVGEEPGVLWLATRQLAGRPLGAVGRLDRRRAARLGVQLANQLAALEARSLAPAELNADDIVVEGEGAGERAWLLPDPARPVAADAAAATSSLVELLNDRSGKHVADPATNPHALVTQLGKVAEAPQRGRLVPIGLSVGAVAIVAAVVAGLYLRGGHHTARPAQTAIPLDARVVARIPISATVGSLAIGSTAVWVGTIDGTVVRVDPAITGSSVHRFGLGRRRHTSRRVSTATASGPPLGGSLCESTRARV